MTKLLIKPALQRKWVMLTFRGTITIYPSVFFRLSRSGSQGGCRLSQQPEGESLLARDLKLLSVYLFVCLFVLSKKTLNLSKSHFNVASLAVRLTGSCSVWFWPMILPVSCSKWHLTSNTISVLVCAFFRSALFLLNRGNSYSSTL